MRFNPATVRFEFWKAGISPVILTVSIPQRCDLNEGPDRYGNDVVVSIPQRCDLNDRLGLIEYSEEFQSRNGAI